MLFFMYIYFIYPVFSISISKFTIMLFAFSNAADRILLHDASQHKPTPISQWSEAERVLIPDSKPVRHEWCDGAREKQQTATGGAL